MKTVQYDIQMNARGCLLGVLVMENVRGAVSEKLAALQRGCEETLREKYGQMARSVLKELHPMDVYVAYYKKFGYTYHVLPQLESVLKGKSMPGGLPLVAAMFIAELSSMLLTAGHDLDKLRFPLRLEQATGEESYTTLSGRDVCAVPRDYCITDGEAPISSILRGPDARTCIDEGTQRALYTVYAPAGIREELVYRHLNETEACIRAFSEQAVTGTKQVYAG